MVAVTLNHENLAPADIDQACAAITAETGLPCVDVLRDGADALVAALAPQLDAALARRRT